MGIGARGVGRAGCAAVVQDRGEELLLRRIVPVRECAGRETRSTGSRGDDGGGEGAAGTDAATDGACDAMHAGGFAAEMERPRCACFRGGQRAGAGAVLHVLDMK